MKTPRTSVSRLSQVRAPSRSHSPPLPAAPQNQNLTAVVNGVIEREVLIDKAARLMGTSERPVGDCWRRIEKERATALAHVNRG